MVARIIRIVVLGGLLVGAIVAVRWLMARWRGRDRTASERSHLARQSPRYAEALDLQERVVELAQSQGLGVEDEAMLLGQIDAILGPLGSLVRLQLDLHGHLEGLDVKLAGERGGSARVEAQRAQIARLREQEKRLQREVAQVVTELRQIYLELLEGVSVASLDGVAASRRAQELALEVQTRVEAEHEVREALARA